MRSLRQFDSSPVVVALASFALFVLPMGLFLLKFRADAPFYFLAQDSFYYLSIALHSAHTPFFTIDGLHPTNGFHPLWECFESLLSRLPFFRLDGAYALARVFAVDLVLVGVAVSLLSSYVYRLTRRPWLSLVAICPGLLWLLLGVGAPAYLNFWASVNGMETGLELLFLSVAAHLFGRDFRFGARFCLGVLALGLVVLSRLDDVFFVLAVCAFAALRAPVDERGRRLAPFALPALLIAAYLLYNHHTVGIWMPVSGMAKAGKGYRASVGETLRLLKGWPFFAMPAGAVAFAYANTFVMVAQMLAPMAVAGVYLVWTRRNQPNRSTVLQSLAAGVLLKGSYNFLRVPIGYQGAWYYGASIATADMLLAAMLAEALQRWSAACRREPSRSLMRSAAVTGLRGVALLGFTFLGFNIVASRASQNGFAATRDAFEERARVTSALRAATSAPFLEFQDGELSFSTGLPAVSGFGLAADPVAVRAQQSGTFFDLLAQRGVTVAAASNTYPAMLAGAQSDKAIFAVWGFNAEEIEHYCFEPFWNDPKGNIVLYHILHQARCPVGARPR